MFGLEKFTVFPRIYIFIDTKAVLEETLALYIDNVNVFPVSKSLLQEKISLLRREKISLSAGTVIFREGVCTFKFFPSVAAFYNASNVYMYERGNLL